MAKRNKFPFSEYEAIKNDSFTLVVFENGKRVSTYGGLNAARLIQEQINCQGMGRTTLVVNDKVLDQFKGDKLCLSRDINDYKELFRINDTNLYLILKGITGAS